VPVGLNVVARLDERSVTQVGDQARRLLGGAGGRAGQDFSDELAKYLSSATATSRMTSALNKIEKYGDDAGGNFAENMASSLGITLRRVGDDAGKGLMSAFVSGARGQSETVNSAFEGVERAASSMGLSVSEKALLAAGGVAAIGLAAVKGAGGVRCRLARTREVCETASQCRAGEE
jgi:hypothetical protein